MGAKRFWRNLIRAYSEILIILGAVYIGVMYVPILSPPPLWIPLVFVILGVLIRYNMDEIKNF